MNDNSIQSTPEAPGQPMPTALEIAEQKAAFDSSPLTTRLLAAIKVAGMSASELAARGLQRVPTPSEALEDGKAVRVSDSTAEAICYTHCQTPYAPELCSPEVKQRLIEIQARMLALIKKMAEYAPGKVSDYLHTQRDRMQSEVNAGNDLSSEVLPSRDAIVADFQTKRTVLHNLLIKITLEELLPLATPILQAFDVAVEEFLRYREVGDRETCRGFGIEFSPSIYWKAGAAVAGQSRSRRLPAFNWELPSSLLRGVVSFETFNP